MTNKYKALLAMVMAFSVILSTQRFAAAQEEKTDVMITAIVVSGNYEVSEDEILSVVTSAVGSPLSTEQLEEDLQKIFDLGYFSKDVKASLAEFEGGARVTFRVEENPVVSDISFEGNAAYDSVKLGETMGTKKNKVLNSNTLRVDVENLEKLYYDNGYLAARVIDAEMDPNGVLNVIISEGIIENIRIEYIIKNEDDPEASEIKNSGKTKPYVITREMKTKVGEIYNTDKIGNDLQRIYNLGFFEDVHTKVDPGSEPGKIVLVIEVEEMNTGTVGFGAGYSSSTGITGFLSLSERNLKGKGRKGDLKLEFGGKRNNYEIGYFEPWLDNKQTSVEVSAYNTSKENLRYGLAGVNDSDYEEIRRGFTLTVGRPMSEYLKVFVGFKTETIDVKPSKYNYLDGDSRSMTGTLRYDNRDNVFNPTKGRYDTASLEVNGGVLGGDFDYQKLILDLRRFRPMRKKQVLAMRGRFGLGRNHIPRFDWFDVGGVNTVRGYDEYEFAGTKMIIYNAEYRFNMSGNLSAVVFGDAGAAWNDMSDFDLNPLDMPKSVGAGLRLKIPAFGIGPVRLDYAYALTIQESKIHFGFGHMF